VASQRGHGRGGYHQKDSDRDREYTPKGDYEERDFHKGRGRHQDSKGDFHNKYQERHEKDKHWENDRFEADRGYADEYKRDNRGDEGYRGDKRRNEGAAYHDKNDDRGGYNQRRIDEGRRYPEKQNNYDSGQLQGQRPRKTDNNHENQEHNRGDHRRDADNQKHNHDGYQRDDRRKYDKGNERAHGEDQAYGRGEYGQQRGNKYGHQGYDDHKKNFEHGEHGQQRYFDSRQHNQGRGDLAGAVNMQNPESQKEGYPQILKELAPNSKHQPKRFNKDSQSFSVNTGNQSTLTLPSALGMPIPTVLGELNMPASNLITPKDSDSFPNTNNYSNNSFNQTIYIKSQGQQGNGSSDSQSPMNTQQSYSPHMGMPMMNPQMMSNMYGYSMPHMNQLGGGMFNPQMMQNQMDPQMMAMINQGYNNYNIMQQMPQQYNNNTVDMSMINPQMMNQMMNYGGEYGYENSGYEQQSYGHDMDDDPSDFISMLQMYMENMQAAEDGDQDQEQEEEEGENVDQLLEEAEFERQQEEADKLDELSKDCKCCKGYPLKCRAAICESLGMCHCLLRRNKEEEPANKEQNFVEEHKSCSCCNGYIFACKGVACNNEGQCRCMTS
jgi:hypothetical protein